VHHHVTCTR